MCTTKNDIDIVGDIGVDDDIDDETVDKMLVLIDK